MSIIVKKALPVGFKHGEQRIKEVAARPAIVLDSIEAIEELGPDCSKARLRVAIEARQVRFTGIPEEEHTLDLVMSLCDKDYAALTEAVDEVEKKLLAQSES